MSKFILLLDGMMGVGKTTTSKILSDNLPRTATLSPDIVKKTVSDFEQGTKDYIVVKKVVVEMARKFLELDFSVIVETVLEEEVPIYDDMASRFSVPCYKFQLVTTPEIAYGRVLKRHINSKKKRSKEHIKGIISSYGQKSISGFEVIDTSKAEPDDVAKMILRKVTG